MGKGIVVQGVFFSVFLEVALAQAGGIQYHHSDHLGSLNLTTDQNADVVESITYTPFGEISNEIRDTKYASRFQFTGQEFDAESSLLYLGARHEDPTTARFLSIDPLFDHLNPYEYARNNPIFFTDPNGKAPESPTPTPTTKSRSEKTTFWDRLEALFQIATDPEFFRRTIQGQYNVSSGLTLSDLDPKKPPDLDHGVMILGDPGKIDFQVIDRLRETASATSELADAIRSQFPMELQERDPELQERTLAILTNNEDPTTSTLRVYISDWNCQQSPRIFFPIDLEEGIAGKGIVLSLPARPGQVPPFIRALTNVMESQDGNDLLSIQQGRLEPGNAGIEARHQLMQNLYVQTLRAVQARPK